VLISDLMDKSGYETALKFLVAQNMDVYVIHVLSQEEIDPEILGDLKLVDCSTSGIGAMNWFESALSPFQWVLLGLVPLIIFLLYFLKLRRTPVEVPSTYLWTKALEDIHVNSLWQRLRRNLLMFLQLLLAMLLLLSCLRPGCEGTKLKDDRFVFLIDHSASMSATDMPGGKSRLEVAKEEAIKLIDRMKSSDSAMVISFSDVSRTVQSYTTNPSQLKNRVRSIRQTQRSSDMLEALNAASGLANPGRTGDKNSFPISFWEV